MGETPRLKRAVLDTNVVVSALLFSGPPSQLVALWQGGAFEWAASAEIVKEYARVLAYPKFKLSNEEVNALLNEDVLPYILAVQVDAVPAVIAEDPSDNHFLTCAVAGHAQAIVSGDSHLLNLGVYQNIPILTIRRFLEQIE